MHVVVFMDLLGECIIIAGGGMGMRGALIPIGNGANAGCGGCIIS